MGGECAAYGKKLLLLYGQSHFRAGAGYPLATASLRKAGISWLELGGIGPNPTLELVRRGIAMAREHRIEVVAAVGGGSVLDSAKAVAAGACVEHDVWLFFRGKKSVRRALPVICVPTLAGSGSEYNHGMVLSNPATGQKIGLGNRHLLPKVAIMDPELSFTAPWEQSLYGAVDAGTHLLEIALGPQAGRRESWRLQDRVAAALLQSIMDSCELIRSDPADYRARSELLWASALTLGGLNQTGRGRVEMPVHLLAHTLGGRWPQIPHGAWLAILLPPWLKLAPNRNPPPGAILAPKITAWQKWLQRVNAPDRLSQLNLSPPPPDPDLLVKEALGQSRQRSRPEIGPELLAILRSVSSN